MLTFTDVKELLEQTNDEPILSLYLLVDPALQENRSTSPGWLIWLKKALRDIGEQVPENLGDVWTEMRARLDTFLSSYVPEGKTLVLFAGHSGQQVFELPVPVKNYVSFGEPALAQLLRAIDEYQPYLLVRVTHDNAHFFIMTCEGIQHQTEMDLQIIQEQWRRLTLMPATAAGGFARAGSHRDRYSKRVSEQAEHFYREVAEEATRLSVVHKVEQTILAGNQEAAHAVYRHMPDHSAIGPIAVANYLPPHELFQQMTPVVVESRLEQEQALVQDIIGLARSGGNAALGMDVLPALEQGVVDLLVLPLSSANDLLVNTLAFAGLRAGAQIKLVSGTAAETLLEECGIAARLYYKLPVNLSA